MKKLLSLLAVLGLAGFVIAPIYAEEEVIDLDFEPVAEEELAAEDVAVDEFNYAEEGVALDATAEDYTVDLGEIDSFNDIFENEEVKAALDEAGITNEEAAGLLGGFVGLFAGLGIVGIIVAIIWGILLIIAMWKIFEKAGEAGWKSIIPIYNVYIMYKIVGMKNWFWYTIIAAFCLGFIAGLL